MKRDTKLMKKRGKDMAKLIETLNEARITDKNPKLQLGVLCVKNQEYSITAAQRTTAITVIKEDSI